MYKIDGLPHYVDIYGQNLAKAQAVPQNTSADGNGGAVEFSGINGAVEVVARVYEDVEIASTKVLTIKVQHSDEEGSGFSDLGTVFTETMSTTTTFASGHVLGRFALPSHIKDYAKAVISSTDAGASGKLDVIPTYLPR